jgi:transposase InsO family protein
MISVALQRRGRLPLARMARTLGFSRSAFYRHDSADRDVEVRDAIQAIALDWPRYGYRTITRELRRRGILANEKRVRRIMRAERLLCRRRKRRGLPYRKHGFAAYPNLAVAYAPTRVDELWVADFTYVHFRSSFIFVAVILDAFSRRCIGWSLAAHYRNSLVIEALRMAIHRRRPQAGFIHHSDRGGEYFDDDYLTMLREHGAQISMSRAGTPSDNAICERFMRTFKEDEVYIRDYATFDDAHRSIARFLDVTYNERRLHSSIGYLPPAEFEAAQIEPTFHPTPA